MCTPSSYIVQWTLDEKFMNMIYNNLENSKNEIGGKIYFEDHECSKKGICNKIIKDFKISNGNGASVITPYGVINFHTHPKSAYLGENAVYGWPSGEDMALNLSFADKKCLIHLVFSLEGVYVINVKKTNLSKKDRKILEEVFKMTHVFRTENKTKQLKDFKSFLSPIIKNTTRNAVKLWLDLANKISLKDLYILYNSVNEKNLKVPDNTEKIFDIKLVKNSKIVKFKGNFVSMSCHKQSFYG